MTSPASKTPQIFDRARHRANRRRAQTAAGTASSVDHFLYQEIAQRLGDRLLDVNRRFARALDLAARGREIARLLRDRGAETVVVMGDAPWTLPASGSSLVVADDEALPFAPSSFDLVVSCLALHWVNDVPGTLVQAQRILRPDGLFLAAFLGGDTLFELRASLMEAEIEIEGGAGLRVSPFAELPDAGMLLQRAGFALPVIDRDTIVATYADAFALMRDLRAMGEQNAAHLRRRTVSRRCTMARAAEIYAEKFGRPDGRIPATFQIVYLSGWAPDPSQQAPLRPGSAAMRLADALGTGEIRTGVSPTGR